MAKEKENTEIAEVPIPKQTFGEFMLEELGKKADALPRELNMNRFVTNAVALIQDHPELQKFPKQQLAAGLMKGAMMNLDFFSSECYLIPYSGQLQFMPSYKGSVKMAKLYSERPIKDIFSQLVRNGDDFKTWSDDDGQHYLFNPKPFNDGAIIGAFAVAKFVDGGVMVDSMSLADLENTRRSSKAANSPAWKSFSGEMYRKTVLHRLTKHITLVFENPLQKDLFMSGSEINTDEPTEEVPDLENIIDVEGSVVNGE